jgi:hypothetical protein
MSRPITEEEIDRVAGPLMWVDFKRHMLEDHGTFKLYPGAILPLGRQDFEMIRDTPPSWQFPCDFSVTRWPEGAEL